MRDVHSLAKGEPLADLSVRTVERCVIETKDACDKFQREIIWVLSDVCLPLRATSSYRVCVCDLQLNCIVMFRTRKPILC